MLAWPASVVSVVPWEEQNGQAGARSAAASRSASASTAKVARRRIRVIRGLREPGVGRGARQRYYAAWGGGAGGASYKGPRVPRGGGPRAGGPGGRWRGGEPSTSSRSGSQRWNRDRRGANGRSFPPNL